MINFQLEGFQVQIKSNSEAQKQKDIRFQITSRPRKLADICPDKWQSLMLQAVLIVAGFARFDSGPFLIAVPFRKNLVQHISIIPET